MVDLPIPPECMAIDYYYYGYSFSGEGHYCDFTDPMEEPCCASPDREAQDACLVAKGHGSVTDCR